MDSTLLKPDESVVTSRDFSSEDDLNDSQIMFFSFGMFIIDEIEYLPSTNTNTTTTSSTNPDQDLPIKPRKTNIPGGAGLYALFGARLLSPFPYSKRTSWILDAGSDFPTDIESQIQSWRTSTLIRHDESRLTTRAWNGYHANEVREFKYVTPKLRLDVRDLDPDLKGNENMKLAGSKSWHLVCSAARCTQILMELDKLQTTKGIQSGKGKVVVWEPIPDLCLPGEVDAVRNAARLVSVISPNREELGGFFEDTTQTTTSTTPGTHNETGKEMSLDEMVSSLMGWPSNSTLDRISTDTNNLNEKGARRTACIVRCGREGSTVYLPPDATTTTSTSTSTTTSTSRTITGDKVKGILKLHLPAYHTHETAHRVIDPTGGGNTYLGALALVLAYLSPFPTSFTSTSTNTNSNSNTNMTKTKTKTNTKKLPPAIEIVHSHIMRVALNIGLGIGLDTDVSLYMDIDDIDVDAELTIPVDYLALIVASICACVAAGFAIEQTGVPGLSYADAEGEGELWGGDRVERRVREYLTREGFWIGEQMKLLAR